jgi:hypothetical protein
VDAVDRRTVLHTLTKPEDKHKFRKQISIDFLMHLKQFTNHFDVFQLVLSEEEEYLIIEYQQ